MDRYNDGQTNDACDLPADPPAAPPGLAAASLVESDPWVAAMRRVLAGAARTPSIHEVAGALGVSARTLQRHLRSLGTTFRAEAKAARGPRSPGGRGPSGGSLPAPARRLFGWFAPESPPGVSTLALAAGVGLGVGAGVGAGDAPNVVATASAA